MRWLYLLKPLWRFYMLSTCIRWTDTLEWSAWGCQVSWVTVRSYHFFPLGSVSINEVYYYLLHRNKFKKNCCAGVYPTNHWARGRNTLWTSQKPLKTKVCMLTLQQTSGSNMGQRCRGVCGRCQFEHYQQLVLLPKVENRPYERDAQDLKFKKISVLIICLI